MKYSKHLFLPLAVLVISLGAVACSSTQPPSEQVDDAVVTTKIKTKITADPELNPFEIHVDTEEGVVRLSGTVDTADDRAEAEKLARKTEGVRRVVNDIQVGDKTLGESLSDTEITAKIKTKLAADPEIDPFNIEVSTNQGVVTLTGRVAKAEARDEAEKLAKNTTGVKKVDNRIKVGDRS
ncbi:MAG: BON domain-containing protein [Acidobacteria bacterium]|nr:BON domain-containing protein [Acidobacteriota bacterium]